MANFDLGLTLCRVRERAEGAQFEYIKYFRKNKINFDDKTNPLVNNYRELIKIGKTGADNCETEADTQALMNRIAELKKIVK